MIWCSKRVMANLCSHYLITVKILLLTHDGMTSCEFSDFIRVWRRRENWHPYINISGFIIYITYEENQLLSPVAYPPALRQLLWLRLQSCKTKRVLAPQNIPPHHHFRCMEVCVCVFKWDNGVNLKTMLCACQGFEAEPSTIVPRGIYPQSLPTTLLNSTSVRFYNTIVRLNRFLFGCATPPPLLCSLSPTSGACVFALPHPFTWKCLGVYL